MQPLSDKTKGDCKQKSAQLQAKGATATTRTNRLGHHQSVAMRVQIAQHPTSDPQEDACDNALRP
jgi:hypothetical protein